MPKLDNKTAKAVHDSEGSQFALLEEDEYTVQLDKVVVSPKPDANGNSYWIWTFTVISGQMTGDKFKGKVISTNTGWAENQLWFAKMVFAAFDAKPNVDTDTLLGKQVKALVGQREIQKGPRKGQMASDIQSLLPMTSGEDESDDWAADDPRAESDEPDF